MRRDLTFWICQQAIRYRDHTHNSKEASDHLDHIKESVDQNIDSEDMSLRSMSIESKSLKDLEESYIKLVIENTNTYKDAAEVLGITSQTLYKKRKKYNLD